MSRLQLTVSVAFLRSRYAPKMCLFTGRQTGLVSTPLSIQRQPTYNWGKFPTPAQRAKLEQHITEVRRQAVQHALDPSTELRIQGSSELITLPHVAAARWLNRAPALIVIAMVLSVTLGVAMGLSLFLEPDPTAMAIKQGLPKPPANAPPPPPTAVSPLALDAWVLYGSVALVLSAWWLLRRQFVIVIAHDYEVHIQFPRRLRYVYETYQEAYTRYQSGSTAPARPTLPPEEWPDEVQQGWDEQTPHGERATD